MRPLYVLCPHCEFPAVIRGFEREVARRCRQCRGAYVPCEANQQNGTDRPVRSEQVSTAKKRRLLALRAILRNRPRKAV